MRQATKVTVGCNVLTEQAVFGGISIACVLMVMIYSLGKSSGGNFNPAVSLALGLAKKMAWKEVQVSRKGPKAQHQSPLPPPVKRSFNGSIKPLKQVLSNPKIRKVWTSIKFLSAKFGFYHAASGKGMRDNCKISTKFRRQNPGAFSGTTKEMKTPFLAAFGPTF